MAFYINQALLKMKKEWLDHLEEIITHVSLKWNGVTIVTGGFNIDFIDGDKMTVKTYKNILDAYGLTQHISYPRRLGKSHIDHIIPSETVSDHDAPFVVLNIRKQKFQPRYKFI